MRTTMDAKKMLVWDIMDEHTLQEEWEKLSLADGTAAIWQGHELNFQSLDQQEKLLEWEVVPMDVDVKNDCLGTENESIEAPVKPASSSGPKKIKKSMLEWQRLHQNVEAECRKTAKKSTEAGSKEKVCLERNSPPPVFRGALLQYQEEWLAWSLRQEASNAKGGILADEMSMHKTVQANSAGSSGLKKLKTPMLQWQLLEQKFEEEWRNTAKKDTEAGSKEKVCLERKSPPPAFRGALLQYQEEWLAWSLRQEASNAKGGILADEMGMGKTVQAISLIVTDRALHGPLEPSVEEKLQCTFGASASSRELQQVKATLVICPVVAVNQWRCEIEKFTAPGFFKVLVFHGPKRSLGVAELSHYDIILSTYNVVQSEHRKSIVPQNDRRRKYCFVCQSPRPTGESSSTAACLGGLQLAQVSALVDELGNKITPSVKTIVAPLRTGIRRGLKRKVNIADIYGDLQGPEEYICDDSSSSGLVGGKSVLHSVKWTRVILDEAHAIKNGMSGTAKAIFALKSTYKWALSGTPFQNRVGELQSLVRFLVVDPCSYFFCDKCDCKSLDYEFSEEHKCNCGHTKFQHFSWWNKFITNPMQSVGSIDRRQRAFSLLENEILAKVILRRTKTEQADLVLPPQTVVIRKDVLDTREEDFYRSLHKNSCLQFKKYMITGTVMNNYLHIFALLTRLRQAVLHPYLVLYSSTSVAASELIQEAICDICHELVEDPMVTGCKHKFCRVCLEEFKEEGVSESLCPICRLPFNVDSSGTKPTCEQKRVVPDHQRSSILKRINLERFQSSTKIDALREEIFHMLEKDPGAKAIIFSQFTTMLELIGFCLQKSGLQFVKLDGSINMKTREEMISKFNSDGDIKIFLMSLRCGGVALNLTAASHVFVMDPWWNPAVEQQAQSRVHRLGQYRPVRVVRFVIEDTIEERILQIQERKRLLFEGTLGGSPQALSKLSELDLQYLFSASTGGPEQPNVF